MINIKVLRTEKLFLEESNSSTDFFCKFFSLIDEFKLAELSISFDNYSLKIDFEYDLLSIYDFIENLLKFINSDSVNETFTLLLYERGDDKIVYKKINPQELEIILYNDSKIYTERIDNIKLNKDIFNFIVQFNTLITSFSLKGNNFRYFSEWKKSILKIVRLGNGDNH